MFPVNGNYSFAKIISRDKLDKKIFHSLHYRVLDALLK